MTVHEEKSLTLGYTAGGDVTRQRFAATGGIVGAIAASSCCVLPLVLFTLGATGPWIGRLTSLAPYQPIFVAITIGFLGYGYWLVYFKPRKACAEGDACATPLSNWLVKSGLWAATAIVLIALTFNYTAPIILGLL